MSRNWKWESKYVQLLLKELLQRRTGKWGNKLRGKWDKRDFLKM